MAAIERANQANADVQSAYERAENQGFDKRSLKRVIKHKTNAESDEHRITVNAYMKALGELPLFAMPEAH